MSEHLCETHAPPSLPLCEVRVDVALPQTPTPAAWEKAWRKTLSKANLSALASAPATVVAARACVYGASCQDLSALAAWLPKRLSALPGGPIVAVGQSENREWQGVKVWLSYSAGDVPALLRRPKKALNPFVKGRRP